MGVLFEGVGSVQGAMAKVAALGGTPAAALSFETPSQVYARSVEQTVSGGQLWPTGLGSSPKPLYEFQYSKVTGFIRMVWPLGGASGFAK